MNDDIRRRLWDILDRETEDCRDCTIRLAEYGCQELPTHKEQITQIIAEWRNEGLVGTAKSDAHVWLTEAGREAIEDD